MSKIQKVESLTLVDGRTLSYSLYGSSNVTTTIFYFHSFPSSRLEGKLWHAAAEKLDVRLVVPDRPGMGNSTFQVSRTILDWPNDILALADHLRTNQFYIMGMSGGGPYTLACCHSLPKDRLLGASVVSGMYPSSLGLSGMMFPLRVLLWVAPWTPGLVGTLLDSQIGNIARHPDPSLFRDAFLKEIQSRPEVDRKVFEDERSKDALIESTREGLRQGGQGPAWEASLFGSAWGFELEEIDRTVMLWHGELDINVPVRMAKETSEKIKGATLKVIEGEGHVSYAFAMQEEILRELLGR